VRPRVALGALVAALVALSAPPVLAGTGDLASAGTEPDTWVTVPCATGAITSYASTQRGLSVNGVVVLEGWIRPCDDQVDPRGRFALLTYHAAGYRREVSSPYAAGGGLTTFRWPVDLDGPHASGLRAMCLAFQDSGRLDCVAVVPSFPRGLRPVPTDDPLTQVPPATSDLDPDDSTITCGNCVAPGGVVRPPTPGLPGDGWPLWGPTPRPSGPGAPSASGGG